MYSEVDIENNNICSCTFVGCSDSMFCVLGLYGMLELRLAAAGWLGGFGNPPPSPPMAGWLGGAPLENSQNT